MKERNISPSPFPLPFKEKEISIEKLFLLPLWEKVRMRRKW